jgi:hypothetical protein
LVKLQGHKFDLEDLPLWFGDAECVIEQQDDSHYLTSSGFDSLTDAGEVWRAGNRLLDIVNSLGMLDDSSLHTVEAVCVVQEDDAGQRHHFVFGAGSFVAGLSYEPIASSSGIMLRFLNHRDHRDLSLGSLWQNKTHE